MLKIYNTLTKQKEDFQPNKDQIVHMFVCGPTVYDYSHIGHARTYIAFDVIAKFLRYLGYDVFYLQNITDIDDRIIARAKESGKKAADVAEKFAKVYFEDMKSIGVDSISEYAPATKYISEIVSQVKRLAEKGYAYFIEGDGYYFDLSKDPEYGKLSGRTTESAEDAVTRIDESIKKRNKGDFALWKLSNGDEPGWETELGYGRPGWHIEDTAITEKHFGPQYDLHGGARDLLFPHHEAEIAQMESLSGKKPFVKYWTHTGFLTIKGQKMSKSLGNFITIRDELKKYSREVLRFMMLLAHYRSPIDYSDQLLEANAHAIKGIGEFLAYKNFWEEKVPAKGESEELNKIANLQKTKIMDAMDDDLNTPFAIGHFFDLMTASEPFISDGYSSKTLDEMIEFSDKIFGIIPTREEIPTEIKELAEEREKIRSQRDFVHADETRKKIKELGYEIDDTPYGPLIKKIDK